VTDLSYAVAITDLPPVLHVDDHIPRREKICVLIPVTSRKQTWEVIEDSYVAKFAFPGLAKTYEPHKYRYSVYLGYDLGDSFFDNLKTLSSLSQRAKELLPFANLVLKPFANKLNKPGPVMNFLSREAYKDGCDFLYHVNDDTELLTPLWSSKFVDALKNFTPPLLGVVGPRCRQGNTVIITHDFVHRGHLDLFSTHYPPQLTDWYMDDWITWIYGPSHTRMLEDAEVMRHDLSARYEIDWESQLVLKKLIGDA